MLLGTIQALEIEVAETLLQTTMLFGLVLAIAFFVAAELALIAASREQIGQLAQQTHDPSKAKAARLVQSAQNDLQHYLSVTQTGTTAGSLLLGWIGEGATVHWIEPWIGWLPIDKLPAMITTHLIAIVIAFALVTYTEILLGELVPKVLASQAPEQTALLLVRPLQICSYVFLPFLILLNSNVRLLTGWINREQPLPKLSASESPLIQTDLHSVSVAGRLELMVVNQELGLSLPTSPAYRTLAGFMIHHLGHQPATGEQLLWGELELEAASILNGNLQNILIRNVLKPLLISRPETVIGNELAVE
jgi:CBS domain containing-hemolysin-like protein